MWQITAIGNFLPDWIWSALLIFGLLCMAAAWFLGKIPIVSTYRFGIQLTGIIGTVIAIWFLGAASNEAKWQQAMEEAKKEKEQIEKEAKKANAELQTKLSSALDRVDDLRKINNQQSSALSNALKNNGTAVSTIKETVIQNMSSEEKAVYEKMNAEQKTAYDKKIEDLIKQYKQCPNIPAFNVEEIEKKIRPPRRPTELSKEEKK